MLLNLFDALAYFFFFVSILYCNYYFLITEIFLCWSEVTLVLETQGTKKCIEKKYSSTTPLPVVCVSYF